MRPVGAVLGTCMLYTRVLLFHVRFEVTYCSLAGAGAGGLLQTQYLYGGAATCLQPGQHYSQS